MLEANKQMKRQMYRTVVNDTTDTGYMTVVSADYWFTDLHTGEYAYSPVNISKAHAGCFNQYIHTLDALKNKQNRLPSVVVMRGAPGTGKTTFINDPTNTAKLFNGVDVVVDNTNIYATEIAPYVLGASAFGGTAVINTLTCDPKIAGARNVHGVPADKVVIMHKAMMEQTEQFPPYWSHMTIDVTTRELVSKNGIKAPL